MTDLLRIGLSSLLAQQRALATTSNNIANANTQGYSRQRVDLAERSAQRLGNDWVGTGVQAGGTTRITDDIIADQLRIAAGGFHRADAFVGMAQSLDDLLASDQTGLASTLQSFSNAVQGIANEPSSTPARQALLSDARNLISRFAMMDQRMTELGGEVTSRLTATTTEINSLGTGIADINHKILDAGGASSPELMDQRDRMLERLSELVQVDTAVQRDGTLSVFVGSGQVLVLGTQSSQLAVTPGTLDATQPQIVMRGTGPDLAITQFLTGGELGGLLDFNRELLQPTRSELGRLAVGLADTVNTMHRNGMDLDGQLGGNFFAVPAPQTAAATTNAGTGTVAATITGVAALQSTNYRLTWNGTAYALQRADNGAVVAMTGAGTGASPFVADGLSIVVGGTPTAGDQFLIRPLDHVAGNMQLLVTNVSDVAAASPTRTRANLANSGTGSISAGQVTDAANPALLTTATIQFINATTYSVNGAGAFAYTPGGNIDVNGTRVQIAGAPNAGDQFVIQSNAGGVGDNRNALRIAAAL
ncbi:MAG TPA: flagellar hook-associated protein FlgK, partial [Gammaproteobacteria bacterium]|nr:flagellar hook-associated protein FlgK [Gammaproteobacteria bacterium]